MDADLQRSSRITITFFIVNYLFNSKWHTFFLIPLGLSDNTRKSIKQYSLPTWDLRADSPTYSLGSALVKCLLKIHYSRMAVNFCFQRPFFFPFLKFSLGLLTCSSHMNCLLDCQVKIVWTKAVKHPSDNRSTEHAQFRPTLSVFTQVEGRTLVASESVVLMQERLDGFSNFTPAIFNT